MYIVCKKSKKSESLYVVLVINGVYVSFDRSVIEKLAMTNGISNVDISLLQEDEYIEINIMKGVN